MAASEGGEGGGVIGGVGGSGMMNKWCSSLLVRGSVCWSPKKFRCRSGCELRRVLRSE